MTSHRDTSLSGRLSERLASACLIVAACLCAIHPAQADLSAFTASITQCSANLGLDDEATPDRCPRLHAEANAIDYPLNTDQNGWPTGRTLTQLQRTMKDLTIAPAMSESATGSKLDAILEDYQFDSSKERIGMGTRFADWLSRLLKDTGIGERLQSMRDSFGMDTDTRTLLERIFTGLLIVVVALTLIIFGRTLWRYLDPNVTKQRADVQYGSALTGADRGNVPVMTARQIDQLPLSEQPPALLVAALSDLRGKELPANVWKYTNRELLAMLAKRDSELHRPLSTLTSVAELALYGNRAPDQGDIDRCQRAATDIQSMRTRDIEAQAPENELGAAA